MVGSLSPEEKAAVDKALLLTYRKAGLTRKNKIKDKKIK